MRVSTNWPRSCPAARKTRDQFYKEQYNSSPSSRRMSNRISRSGRSRNCLRSKPLPSSVQAATSSRPNARGPGTSARSTSVHAKTMASCRTRSRSVKRMASKRGQVTCNPVVFFLPLLFTELDRSKRCRRSLLFMHGTGVLFHGCIAYLFSSSFPF